MILPAFQHGTTAICCEKKSRNFEIQQNTCSFAHHLKDIMKINPKQYILSLFALCLILFGAQPTWAQSTSLAFEVTVLKSTGEPQTQILLKVNGRSTEYRPNEEGVIAFEFELNKYYTHTASLYFTQDKEKAVASFSMDKNNAVKKFYLDTPEDVIGYKQQNNTFLIEGIVTDENDQPITGVSVGVQGTGKRTVSDEIGLFQIEADYNHSITLRAEGMENLQLDITPFLQSSSEPYRVKMKTKGNNKIYSVVEQMPDFPGGGMKAFQRYQQRNLKYPEQFLKDSIEGAVGVQFVVETNGEITSPSIVRHLNPVMDSLALNLIREMPHWIPGKDHGQPVRCKRILPIQFKVPQPKPQPKQPTQNNSYWLATDSVIGKEKHKELMKPDSLIFINDSLKETATDSIKMAATDSLQKAEIVPQNEVAQPAVKAKKRNFLVRFFRWLFGKKEKTENQTDKQVPAHQKAPAEKEG